MAHDVFISYASQDKAIADAICATLEGRKIRCWISPRDAVPGIPYAEALVQALNGSRILVLVFSSNSNKSPHVMRELERVVSKGITIIPFRIEDIQPSMAMEYFISNSHWLDALTPPLEKHINQLADTIRYILDKDQEYTNIEKPTGNAFTSLPVPKSKTWGVNSTIIITMLLFIIVSSGVVYLIKKSPQEVTGEKTNTSITSSTTNTTEKPDNSSVSSTTNTIDQFAIEKSDQLKNQAQALFIKNDDPNRIIDLCSQAIELNPRNDLAYEFRGLSYQKINLLEKAMDDLNKAIEINPNYAFHYHYRGKLWPAFNNYEAGINDLKKAISVASLTPGDPISRDCVEKSKLILKTMGVSGY